MEKEESNGGMMPNNWPAGATTLGAFALGATLLGGLGVMTGRGGNGGPNMQQENSDLKAELAQMKAQSYSDQKIFALAEQTAKNTAAIAAQNEISALRDQLNKKDAEIDVLKSNAAFTAQINAVAAAGIQTAGAVSVLQQTVGGLTQVGIPSTSVIQPIKIATASTADASSNG